MNKYKIKRLIKYAFLLFILVVATQQVYKFGKKSYQNYINAHESDLEWVENNISLEDDYQMGSQVKVVRMPVDLTVSDEDYTEIINKKIKALLVNSYSINSPILIYNPYRGEQNMLYIYFHTGENYQAQYFVSTESIAMQDMDALEYQNFLDENGNITLTMKHYYKINSLVPGKKNNVILRILDENGVVVDAENFILNIPNEGN